MSKAQGNLIQNKGAEAPTRKAIRVSDLAIGESVIGYVKDLFKVANSKTPDVENISLETEEGQEITVWASGSLRYFRERMTEKKADLGVLCKITRIDRPATAKSKDQKTWCDIGFNLSKTREFSASSSRSGAGRVDGDGFEF